MSSLPISMAIMTILMMMLNWLSLSFIIYVTAKETAPGSALLVRLIVIVNTTNVPNARRTANVCTVTNARETVNVMDFAEVVKEIANVEDTVMLAQLTAAVTHVPNVKQTADSVTENVAAVRRTAGAQFVPTVEIDVLKKTTGTVEKTAMENVPNVRVDAAQR